MEKERLLSALRDIGLALSVVNNAIATDAVGVEPTDTSWRVNHSRELALLDEIQKAIAFGDLCPMCGVSRQNGDVAEQIRERYKLTDEEREKVRFAGKVIRDPKWNDHGQPGGT